MKPTKLMLVAERDKYTVSVLGPAGEVLASQTMRRSSSGSFKSTKRASVFEKAVEALGLDPEIIDSVDGFEWSQHLQEEAE